MLKQGSYLCHLFIWLLLLLPHFSQPSSPYQCDRCDDKCWKCFGSVEVPTGLEKDLEILDLSDNVMGLITRRSFSGYSKMKELHLSNCSLKIVHGDAFSRLNDLEFVDLSHNKISEILPVTVFRSNINLGEVLLDYNNIVRIKPHFLESRSIRKLDMTGSGITEVSPESFKLLPNLEELRLEKNRLKVLPPNLFPSQKNILNLYIDQSILDVYSCNPRLRIFVGGELVRCDTAESDVAIYTAGGERENTADREVETLNTEFIENNKSENSQISKDVKYNQRTASTSKPSTNGKSEEPIETFLDSLSENVENKMILLILMTAIVLVTTLILYVIVKRCSCYSCCPPQGTQLIPSAGDGNIPVVQGNRASYALVPMLQDPGYTDQVYQPQWRGSQFSDHTYRDTVYS